MKILVTGASGFIGSSIVEVLASDGHHEIWATGRSFTNKFDPYPNVTYFQQDLTVGIPDQVCDACIHCAGLADDKSSREQFINHNVKATENLLHAVRNCKLLIFISSASVYNFADGTMKFEHDVHPDNQISLYGQSKLLAEKAVRESGIKSVYILRPRAVYGRGDRVLLPRILGLIKRNVMILPGKLSSKASMIYIGNLCEMVVKCMAQSAPGLHIFNVADKITYDLRTVFGEILERKTGKKTFIVIPMPIVAFYVHIGSFLGFKGTLTKQSLKYITEDSVIGVEKAERLLDYTGQYEFYTSVDQLDICVCVKSLS
ncbi:NAD-dependent epimerase/dehydratase family protein [Dyadobacter sp. MSC1_007]|jgi:nucleoside-diphosphate-sugar epimerase|uniref:NAD-dependent epimerase/dehydratase family protein n=1 Tax=Dyadobacter sp. MSC1_007 TaxID=2909264 RepID=UPI002030D52F|nr:NAD(P)-dependent oxidoreductase [Dyadobacter sp. MSC1_007]